MAAGASTPDTVGDLGTILGVWAHPDDEAYLSAGLMASAVDAGRRVVCVTATRGEAGFPADDPHTAVERSAIRERELAASLAALGVREHRWLGYPDGGCPAVDDAEASGVIASIIEEVRPDTVLTFGPDGGTGHGDHVSACRWATLAVARLSEARPRLLYATKAQGWGERFLAGMDPSSVMMIDGFEPETWPAEGLAVWLTCDDAMLDRKVAALRAQVSQIEPMVQAVGLDRFRAFNREEFFREPQPADAETIARATAFSRGLR